MPQIKRRAGTTGLRSQRLLGSVPTPAPPPEAGEQVGEYKGTRYTLASGTAVFLRIAQQSASNAMSKSRQLSLSVTIRCAVRERCPLGGVTRLT